MPVDEAHPSTPQDSYGLSKVLGEQIADSIVSVHRDMTVSSLRFPGVNFDLSYEWYYGKQDYFSVGYFNKHLKDYSLMTAFVK